MIDACIEQKVKRLIYTSSPSVVFDGVHAIINGDESLPYPSKVYIGLFPSKIVRIHDWSFHLDWLFEILIFPFMLL